MEDSNPPPITNFQNSITPINIETMRPMSPILVVKKVPMHVPKSFPSEIRLICAESNPRLPKILNNAVKPKAKPTIPYSHGDIYRDMKNRVTYPKIALNMSVATINADFLANMITTPNQKMLY